MKAAGIVIFAQMRRGAACLAAERRGADAISIDGFECAAIRG